MVDYDAMLRAVLADPDDDSPRLILADWLGENRQGERADFVRVQCELEPLRRHGHGINNPHGGTCDNCLRIASLERRELELLDAHWANWLHQTFDGIAPDVGCSTDGRDAKVTLYGTRPRIEELGSFRCEFHRGFVARVSCTWDAWKRHGPAVMRSQPIEEVRLETRSALWVGARTGVANLANPPVELRPLLGEVDYPTEADALRALSDAAILWAKRKAWPCRVCEGQGWVKVSFDAPPGEYAETREPCLTCDGRGWWIGADLHTHGHTVV